MSHKIVIIDYGMGNVGSIKNMLKVIGYSSFSSNSHNDIIKAECLILPGVGHFDQAMIRLNQLNLIEIIKERVNKHKIPILGICLGMQILGLSSEEGSEKGLGLIPFNTTKFVANSKDIKIPNMGFRTVEEYKDSIFNGIFNKLTRYYFVHSFYVPVNNDYTILKSTHSQEFTAALNFENIYGVQFHPEKSHSFGKELLSRFIKGNLDV